MCITYVMAEATNHLYVDSLCINSWIMTKLYTVLWKIK